MDLFDWILLAVLILCIGLILLILWLGEPTRHPQLKSKAINSRRWREVATPDKTEA